MKVPFIDFSAIAPDVRAAWATSLNSVLDSGIFIGGRYVSEFEDTWSRKYCSGRAVVGVGNGFDALSIALRTLGIGKGHQVAVPAHTFIATWTAVIEVGATPVGVDVLRSGQMDLDELFEMNPRPDAVIPVHMHGLTVEMGRLMEWSEKYGVTVLEDCSQAHGMTSDGKPVGTWGQAGAFSFYPIKNLGALGDAGAIVFDDSQLAANARKIANYGANEANKYFHECFGKNSRLDPLQAAVLAVNERHLAEWNKRRAEIAQFYISELRSIRALELLCTEIDKSVWHHFVVLSKSRDEFRMRLKEKGISTEIHYPLSAATEVAAFLPRSESIPQPTFPQATELASHGFSLPMNPWLTQDQVEYVVEIIHSVTD